MYTVSGVTNEANFKFYVCSMMVLPHGTTSAATDKSMPISQNILNLEQS